MSDENTTGNDSSGGDPSQSPPPGNDASAVAADGAHGSLARGPRGSMKAIAFALGITLLAAVTLMALWVHRNSTRGEPTPIADSSRRVIILGFDGVDPKRVDQYMKEGHLPHLQSLAQRGSFSPLATTNPAESPVSWAAFSIGANPGKSNIYDFLKRVPGTYRPDIALVDQGSVQLPDWVTWGVPLVFAVVFFLLPFGIALLFHNVMRSRGGAGLPRIAFWLPALVLAIVSGTSTFLIIEWWVPSTIPTVSLARKGTPFWHSAGEAGLKCCMIQVPVTFPAVESPNGRLLTGLGTPDVKKTWGTHTIYASKYAQEWSDPVNRIDPKLMLTGRSRSITGADLIHLELPSGDRIEANSFVFGPDNFVLTPQQRAAHPELPDKIDVPLTLRIDRTAQRVAFAVPGGEVSARAGEWTDWLGVKFQFNPLLQFRGIVRFYVRSVTPDLYVYASPVNFHPGEPPLMVPLSAPATFTRDVVEKTGQLHETVGWAIATNPLKDELISEDEFLEDMWFSFERRKRIIETQLQGEDWNIFTGVILATDRVQHMFLRYIDPQHPLYDPDAPDKYKNAILDTHKAMDRMVGEIMEKYLDERTDLWVISDHGFASFRKGVHLNSWLVENGFMALKDPTQRNRGSLDSLFQKSDVSNVDWSRTRAYSMGLGKVYLNRRGREPLGILETPDEIEATLTALRQGLLAFTDPDTGGKVVREVYRREDIYSGAHVDKSADLVVGFERGYRVSWDTCLIEAPPGLLEVNLNKWSGDHCSVDPSLVPGFVVTSRKLSVTDPSIIDMARTVLESLQVTPPPEMEGRNLVE